jgi:hypothetical protein
MADSTRKNRDASLFAWVLLLLWVPGVWFRA